METTLDTTWTVQQIMQTYPKTISVFLALKTNCVGCPLERFCTLAEVAAAYEMSLETLQEKLCQAL
jgi:hybrid cluster-associated redox disulfide protein